ncbi:MAG: ATP-binding protein [Clostridia bacterium]|nr:ATP-binding protein [Clostridia bacterium]
MKELKRLTILRGILNDPVVRALADAEPADDGRNLTESEAIFLHEVYSRGIEDTFVEYMSGVILDDENEYARQCAAGKVPSRRMTVEFADNLAKAMNAACDASETYRVDYGTLPDMFKGNPLEVADNLADYYRTNGYGRYSRYMAFRYEDGDLIPVENPVRVRLKDLKDYEYEKSLILNNITGFLQGYPSLNMLLYGSKGTGKSSTIHAVLNEYFDQKLRLVQIDDGSLGKINEIRAKIEAIPMKWLVFVDDISMSGDDKRISQLKASLEGNIAGDFKNSIIVATSNRRHIVKETFSDRNDAVHGKDTMEEQLSLSDRFGISILFSLTDKNTYLSIVRQLAEDSNIQTGTDELEAMAERWALVKGGRSPRRAKQFIEFLSSCEARKIEPEF